MPLAALIAITVAAGCGSTERAPEPAAEPAVSPAAMERPAGKVIEIGNEPEGLAADPLSGLLAVGLRNPDELALVQMSAPSVVRRVGLDESPRHLQLARPGGPILVPAERANELIEVTLPGGEIATTAVGEFPHDATQAGERMFVGNEFADVVSVIEDGRVIRAIDAPTQPGGVISVDGGRAVAVMGVEERAIALIDSEALTERSRLAVGAGPTHLASLGSQLYVVDTEGDALIEMATAPKLQLTRSTPLAGTPYGIAVDPRRERIWVTLTASNEVVALDPMGAELGRFSTVRQPNTVAVDPRSGRVFIASRSDGTLQWFDPGRLPLSAGRQ